VGKVASSELQSCMIGKWISTNRHNRASLVFCWDVLHLFHSQILGSSTQNVPLGMCHPSCSLDGRKHCSSCTSIAWKLQKGPCLLHISSSTVLTHTICDHLHDACNQHVQQSTDSSRMRQTHGRRSGTRTLEKIYLRWRVTKMWYVSCQRDRRSATRQEELHRWCAGPCCFEGGAGATLKMYKPKSSFIMAATPFKGS